ncbi:MAG: glycosyltransferase family 2 protein [Burkholderiales bacterium]|nr:glycosyltransferase family 2 protein [Burkholderiales bacterium]
MPHTPRHSVVVPVYNEAEVLEAFHTRCTSAMQAIGEDYEILYVDDGSQDASWEILVCLAQGDSRVRLLRLSRNFGHQVAISAGIESARGDTVTTLDADLQDPPEVIADLVAAWHEGADVVCAVRQERRGEPWFKCISASAFYSFVNLFSDIPLPAQAGDFRLLSRRAVKALLAMPEKHRYVRGMVAWIGHEVATVGYSREPRAAGRTKYSLPRMLGLASDGILAFSTLPLRAITWLGLGVTSYALAMGLCLVWTHLIGQRSLAWDSTSLATLILLLAGAQFLTLGVLGQYMGRIYSEVRQRPLYLVRERRGFEDPT